MDKRSCTVSNRAVLHHAKWRSLNPDSRLLTLTMYSCGDRDPLRNDRAALLDDGYDTFRTRHNSGFRLNDPVPDVASVYAFSDKGRALFIGHFKHNLPVNNSRGMQAMHFSDNGLLEKFSLVSGDKVYTIDMNVPTTLGTFRDSCVGITAPSYAGVLQQLIISDPEMAPDYRQKLLKYTMGR